MQPMHPFFLPNCKHCSWNVIMYLKTQAKDGIMLRSSMGEVCNDFKELTAARV